MTHLSSEADQAFRRHLEACEVAPADFDHRAHLRLAYVYLTEGDSEAAHAAMRRAIHGFIECNDVDPSKYHETITRAWILAVRHFMERTPACTSFDAFIEHNPVMLDSKIMLTHYSREQLFSDEARASFVEPDLDPIPRHGD